MNTEMAKRVLLLALGGALGTLARYGLNGVISQRVATFPLGTMIVNISGCLVIGFIAAISDPSFGRTWLKTGWRDFLMVGFCGGYTTFSSYGIQTLNLARDGEWLYVTANIVGSNALGLVAVYLGWVLGRFVQAKFHGGAL
jgi:CrcB protein